MNNANGDTTYGTTEAQAAHGPKRNPSSVTSIDTNKPCRTTEVIINFN